MATALSAEMFIFLNQSNSWRYKEAGQGSPYKKHVHICTLGLKTDKSNPAKTHS